MFYVYYLCHLLLHDVFFLAAALIAGLDEFEGACLMSDIGGSTYDVASVGYDKESNTFTTYEVDGNPELGGCDITLVFVSFLLSITSFHILYCNNV